MSDPRCRCGHDRIVHCNDEDDRLNRGKCTGSVRQWVVYVPSKIRLKNHPSDIYLNDNQTNAIIQEMLKRGKTQEQKDYWAGRVQNMMKKGYRKMFCECPTYHTVDIGHVLIHKPK